MSITSAIVLFAIIWFMVFFIAIPIRLETQGDRGDIVPGTHASSPEVHNKKESLDHHLGDVCFLGDCLRHYRFRPADYARHRLLQPNGSAACKRNRVLNV